MTSNVTETSSAPACAANAVRQHCDGGDIRQSYSADRIAYGQPVRKAFQHNGEAWICTSIIGSALTSGGGTEYEAYRMIPERLFRGTPTTYQTKTGTEETAEAARNDPDGFYHGITVKQGRETFVLCGPPEIFVVEDVIAEPEPLQLSLF
jgi:hypothetical protein